jgi:Tol biopolymer transport system component
MLGYVPRSIFLALVLAGLIAAVPSAAQVGAGKLGVASFTGIYTMSPGGGEVTLIRPAPQSCNGLHICRPTPRWSPDGSLIAFKEDDVIKVMDSAGAHVRTLASLTGGEVTFSRQPWSPDSKEFTYGLGSALVVAVLDGSARTVVQESSPVSDAAWSPTASSIAYATNDQLRLVDPTGGTPRTIASGPALHHLVWSPDGRRISFTRTDGVWTVDADGSGLRRLDARFGYGWPVWSPDGTKIAFHTAVGYYDGFPFFDVFLVDVSTLQEKRLTFDVFKQGSSSEPSWSPDGSWISVERGGPAPASISRIMNADGTCARDLGSALTDGEMFWQPGSTQYHPPGCHALRVEVSSNGIRDGAGVELTVTLVNSGTYSVSGVRLRRLSGTDFTPTFARSEQGTCSLRRRSELCRIGVLTRGESVRVTIRADGRRVTEDGFDGGWIGTNIEARADDLLTDPGAATFPYATVLERCTTKTPGSGLVEGSSLNELLCGRRGPDRIEPSWGRDRVRAGAGNDLIFARDDSRDFVSCGAGRDVALVDRRDKVGRDCESVLRRR